MKSHSIPNGQGLRDTTGRADKCHSTLDRPRYAPYRDGKGQLDVSLTPIQMRKDSDLAEYLFDIDRFWPHYMNRKHELMAEDRSAVYRDINKAKLKHTYDELRWFIQSDVMDLIHPFMRQREPLTGHLNGATHRPLCPNWMDWETFDTGSVPFGTETGAYFQRIKRTENPTTGIEYIYRNFFGGPNVSMWKKGIKYALEELAMTVQEDLCILRRRDDGWNLRAGSVCFPSYWNIGEKIGKPLSFIHSPAPQINSKIDDIITKKMDDLEVGMPHERFNWTITTSDELYQPGTRGEEEQNYIDEVLSGFGSLVDFLFVRVERQIMVKLPSGDIFFTIRTYINSLRAVMQYADLTIGLYGSIRATPDAVLEYRGIDRYKEEIMQAMRETKHIEEPGFWSKAYNT